MPICRCEANNTCGLASRYTCWSRSDNDDDVNAACGSFPPGGDGPAEDDPLAGCRSSVTALAVVATAGGRWCSAVVGEDGPPSTTCANDCEKVVKATRGGRWWVCCWCDGRDVADVDVVDGC